KEQTHRLESSEGVRILPKSFSVTKGLARPGLGRSVDDLVPCSQGREPVHFGRMSYQDIITIEPDKRGGKPCIRGMRITVYDVLEYLASGMSQEQILDDFPELTASDIRACLEFAADRERKLVSIPPE